MAPKPAAKTTKAAEAPKKTASKTAKKEVASSSDAAQNPLFQAKKRNLRVGGDIRVII